jgi:hypothetical protein
LFRTQVGIGVDPQGDVYVVDHHNFRVQKFDNGGAWITMWGTKGYGPSQFESSHALACDHAGNIYVIDYQTTSGSEFGHGYVQKFSSVPVATVPLTWSALKERYGR